MERTSQISERSRYAALVTYCDPHLVEHRLQELLKGGVVRFYAFIEHDKDTILVDDVPQPKQRHTHIVLNTSQPMRQTAFRQLFAHCDGDQNTLATPFVKDFLSDRVRYLCHLDDPDKFQYSLDDVHTNDDQKLANCMQSFIPSPHDDFLQMLSDVLTMSMAQFASVYGRDGVLNYGKYRSFAIEARNQQRCFQSLDPVIQELCTDAFNVYELYDKLESNESDAIKMQALWNVFCQKTQYFYSTTRKNLISLERSAKK